MKAFPFADLKTTFTADLTANAFSENYFGKEKKVLKTAHRGVVDYPK